MKRHTPALGRLPVFARSVATLLVTALTGTFLLTAADPPAGGTADPTGGARGNRGNFQGRGGGGPGGAGGGFGGLGLDEKQTELYREASEVNRATLTRLDEKLRAAQKELLQAVIAEKYDEKVVGDKAEAVAKIQTEMTLLRAKALSTVAPTLKPEQHEQLESSRMAASMLTGGGMVGFGGGGGGPGGFGGPGGGQGGQGGPGGNFGGGNGNGGNGGFRGRGTQGVTPGSENTGGVGGPGGPGGGGGQRRTRDRGAQPTPAPQTPPTPPPQ